MSRGDRITVWMDMGTGDAKPFEVVADANGRKVDSATVRGFVEVTVTDKNNNVVDTWKFKSDRVVALIPDRAEETS